MRQADGMCQSKGGSSGASRLELLAPAGTLEKGKVAIAYGADALYLAGKRFGLRARAGNFSPEEMEEMVGYAHSRGVKVYVTVNIIPHNRDLIGIPQYLEELGELGVDGLIISDPSILTLAREIIPHVDLHLSTQASMTNWRSARFWYQQGIKRIVLARELSKDEIAEIRKKVPEVELEVFIHGAMCISYSGRCLLSAYMAERDANLGDCAQPCRWKYKLVEERHPDEYYSVEETEEGTFVFNSRDLCLIDEIPLLSRLGVTSLKIEGRMKSTHYVASVVGAYRAALQRFYQDPDSFTVDPGWLEELDKVSHRPYTKGFFHGRPGPEGQDYAGHYVGAADFVGMVVGSSEDGQWLEVQVKNRIKAGEELEVLTPGAHTFRYVLTSIQRAETGQPLDEAHPNYLIRIPTDRVIPEYSILRRVADGQGGVEDIR